MLLTIERLSKTYGEKTLFQEISFSIDAGDKIGVVGVNGTGKSTLIRTIAGQAAADSGQIMKAKNLRIEYLAQENALIDSHSVLTEVFRGSAPVMRALGKYETALEESRAAPDCKEARARLSFLGQRVDELDGWRIESDAKAILTRLGITDYAQKIGALSGGQKKRLALASALIQPCDLLILDEPTNHLDSETILWLEETLRKMKSALLLVTHDRYFLDRAATKILELDRGSAYMYVGNYTRFLEEKAARAAREEASERKRQNLLRNELAWMRRGAKARSTKQKARIERFEELKNQAAVPEKNAIEIGLRGARLGRTVIELDGVSFSAGGRQLIDAFSYTALRGDRVGILGPNGSGKTTLLDLIAGRRVPSKGTIKVGQTVRIGYFSQMNADMDEGQRAIAYIREAAHFIDMADGTRLSAAQLMELFLFSGDMQWTPIAKLSGGEKRRLFLLRVLMESPNVLLLDEPTNDLDLQTMAVLEDFIDRFSGAVIFVSHDRYFVDRLANKVFVFEAGGKLRQYIGGYSDYKALADAESPAAKEARRAQPAEAPRNQSAWRRRLSFKEQREYDEIEAVIAEAESELKVVKARMQGAGADFTLLGELAREEEKLNERLAYLMDRWAYLEEIALSDPRGAR